METPLYCFTSYFCWVPEMEDNIHCLKCSNYFWIELSGWVPNVKFLWEGSCDNFFLSYGANGPPMFRHFESTADLYLPRVYHRQQQMVYRLDHVDHCPHYQIAENHTLLVLDRRTTNFLVNSCLQRKSAHLATSITHLDVNLTSKLAIGFESFCN